MGHRRAFCSSFERTITAIKMCSSLKKLIYDCKTKQGQINTHTYTRTKKIWVVLQYFKRVGKYYREAASNDRNTSSIIYHCMHIFFLFIKCVCICVQLVRIDNLADDDDDENYDEKCRNMCTLFIWSANSVILVS